jgi:hypothetical protein
VSRHRRLPRTPVTLCCPRGPGDGALRVSPIR